MASLHPEVAAHSGTTHLPADLARLRDRFVTDYPDLASRAARLAQVPPALRHLLSLRLELVRADALPGRYRELAEAALRHDPHPHTPDAVEQLVILYANAVRDSDQPAAARYLPQLRRYFTEPQVIELTLTLTLASALAQFDALLGLT